MGAKCYTEEGELDVLQMGGSKCYADGGAKCYAEREPDAFLTVGAAGIAHIAVILIECMVIWSLERL